MSDDHRDGYWRDEQGVWQEERRRSPDRRRTQAPFPHRDRRTLGRRKADHDYFERDGRTQIREALEDFAAEHERPH